MLNTTTKPMRSRSRWRWAFGTGQSFAERWARATPGGKIKRFRKLPGHVKKKESLLLRALKANYGAKKGQVIQGRLVRGEGGRFSSSGASTAPARPKRAGKKPVVPKKAVAPKKPVKTSEQRAQERAAASAAARQEKRIAARSARDRILTAAGLDTNLQGALAEAMEGNVIASMNGERLVKLGLAEQAADGTYRLNAPARTVMHAALRGDAGMVGDTLSKARDRAAKLALVKPVAAGGGGGGKKKEPPVKLAPRQTSTPVKPVGGGGAAAKPKQPKAAQPQTDPALTALARRLSVGETLADDEAQTLIRNGLARLVKGELVLTAAGARVIRTKDAPLWRLLARRKVAPTPSRTLHAGHTGVMVALHPDAAALKAIAALPGVTELADQLHVTLAYLGDSTERPLATNKARLIGAIRQWAASAHALTGTINGAGRFFHAEKDNTNAVWVAPDVAGLPELRQSLVAAIEAGGFDYSQDHGFTPHITVAYVPRDAPTPAIRIDTPVTFARATLAWGDAQYDFPLGGARLKAGNPGDYLVVEDRTKPSTWHLQVRKNGTPDHRLMGGAWAALHGGYRGNKYAGPQKTEALAKLRALYASEKMDVPTEKAAALVADGPGPELCIPHAPSFTVYKDHTGAPRWLARTTTAYRDRDREILEEAGLDQDSQRMTTTKQYGPLRWWHVGRPDALDPTAPWGPGLDIGACDFSMQIGRTRVESGTFKDTAIAQKIAATADQYELSPGFFHAADQPDSAGVFGAIHTFERSLVPIRYGRASNLFTGLTVKEHTTMDVAEQERRFKAFVDELKLTPDQAAAYAAGLKATDKAASTALDPATGLPGVAFKSDEQPAQENAPGVIDRLRIWLNNEAAVPPAATVKTADAPALGVVNIAPDPLIAAMTELTSTLKAAMAVPAGEEEDALAAEDDAVAAEDVADAGADEAATIGEMSPTEFFDILTRAFTQALTSAMGGISDKVTQLDNEMKTMGYVRQKDDERAQQVATLKAEIAQQQVAMAAQQRQLAELVSDAPAIPPARPSQDPSNVLNGLKGADPSAPEFAFADISEQLFGKNPGQQPAAH